MAPTAQPTLSYCLDTVRRQDPDRFLTLLFAPADRREDLAALYAFNHEVAKTREVVTEPMLGQIRLQWWRDSIAGIYEGEPRRHEVVQPLAQAAQRHGLDRVQFELLVDAREADMDDAAPADLSCLVSYAEVTSAPLVRLALQILGVAPEGAAATVAAHVGRGWALAGILRAVPFLARAHRSRMPADLMRKHGVDEAALFELKPQPGLAVVAKEIADAAQAELTAARRLRGQLPRAAVPALLPARLASLSLARLAKAGHDPLAPELLRPDGLRAARLAWAALSGRW
ncbi:phytoene/squalene synthase family protein [Nitrospirillum sp. BR 11163]|uniref:phytoene/squalene synthase family protein n=1 Tax=Nitrospirillum sp. BR 11163 TaxID=3104323 RepID=UPI002AFFBBE8|nr:squalene/phytoene synthase family protein [Nitrospirillum sp. BR 11163]MEA1675083.1 squalene/phytoene synthase family protein [Nitrospirillum sp. BR 11163]